MAEPNPPDEAPAEPAGQRNVRTREFRYLYEDLPERIQSLGHKVYALFVEDPHHPSLQLHRLKDNSRGSHHTASWSVSITRKYRAVYFVDGAVNVWYWVGTHADYDRLTGH